MTKQPKGTPTDLNVWCAKRLMRENDGVVPRSVPAVSAPHIRRLLKAGWLVRTAAGDFAPAPEYASRFA